MRYSPVFPALAPALALWATVPLAPAAHAQQNPGFFIPPAARAPAGPAPAAQAPAAPRPAPPRAAPYVPPPLPTPVETPPVQMSLPPVPELPALPKGQTPPAAVVGVLGVPEIMRASTAAQQVQQIIGERREKLNEDAQKEQAAWRELQEQLSNRGSLSPEQARAKANELQARITESQRRFRDRNRQIEEAAQFALAQIERVLYGVINEVAQSRGLNLVVQRAQVVLNTNEFDITQAVTDQLNKVLPQVKIPAEGMNIIVPPEQQPGPLSAATPQPGLVPGPPSGVAAGPAPGAPAPTRP